MIIRLAYALLALPSRLRDKLGIMRLRERCVAPPDVAFTRETTIFNPFAPDAIRIGAGTLFMGEVNVIAEEARVRIGDWCFVGPGTKIWAMAGISIGDRVFISHGVQVFDNNSHSLAAAERHARFRELRTVGRHLQPEAVVRRPISHRRRCLDRIQLRHHERRDHRARRGDRCGIGGYA